MEIEKYDRLLASLPLFRGIKADQIPQAIKCLQAYTKPFEKDTFIRMEGDKADFIGIVLEGTIQVIREDIYGNRSIVSSLSAGEMFAEAFACSGLKAIPVSITAVSPCQILFLDKERLLSDGKSSCDFNHILVRNLLMIVARKNMFLNQKLRYSSHKTTREKLLAYLEDQSRAAGSKEFTIPYDRQALADYLGVERSAMSTEIGKLRDEGILETKRSYFKLLQ